MFELLAIIMTTLGTAMMADSSHGSPTPPADPLTAIGVLADLSHYASYDDVPKHLPILRLPDGTVLKHGDYYDDSEFGWGLWHASRVRSPQEAQRALVGLGTWLSSFSWPLKIYRGFLLKGDEAPSLEGGRNRSWSRSIDVARVFATGSDSMLETPLDLSPGTEAVVIEAQVNNTQQVDWLPTAAWHLGFGFDDSGNPEALNAEEEIVIERPDPFATPPWIMRTAQVIERQKGP